MSNLGRCRGWSRIDKLVAAGVLAMAASSAGLGDAKACGGLGGSGVVSMNFEREPEIDAPVPASNDGFFVIEVVYGGTEAELEAYVAELAPEVKNADGDVVAGSLELLDARPTPQGTLAATLGWSSPEALPPGVYDVALSYPNDAGTPMKNRVEVLAQAPESIELELLGKSVHRLIDDAGDTVQCVSRSTTCSSILDIGVELREYVTLDVTVEASKLPAVGAWSVSLSEVPGKGTMEPLAESPDYVKRSDVFFRATDDFPSWSTGVRFTDQIDEYCVDVTLQNLRSDETYVERVCAKPDRDAEVQSADFTSLCAYPPPAEIAERWCSTENDPSLEACKPYFPDAVDEDPMPFEPDSLGDDSGSNDARGCSIGGTSGKTSSLPWLALGLLGLALVGARRAKRAAR